MSGASGYVVYRATFGGTFTYVTTVTGGSTTSYTSGNLTTDRTYYYKVRAYRTVSGTKVYGDYSAVKSAKPVPAAPAGVNAARISNSSIKVSWSAVAGAGGYEVYRATSRTGTYEKIAITAATYCRNTGLADNRTYYYKVRAYRTVSGNKVYGCFSLIVSATP